MKLIIDIPDYEYRQIKEVYEKNDIVENTYSYIYYGTPLDDVKAEIMSKVPSDKLDDAYINVPYVFKILDKTSKESDDKK